MTLRTTPVHGVRARTDTQTLSLTCKLTEILWCTTQIQMRSGPATPTEAERPICAWRVMDASSSTNPGGLAGNIHLSTLRRCLRHHRPSAVMWVKAQARRE